MNFSFWPFLWFGLPGRLLTWDRQRNSAQIPNAFSEMPGANALGVRFVEGDGRSLHTRARPCSQVGAFFLVAAEFGKIE